MSKKFSIGLLVILLALPQKNMAQQAFIDSLKSELPKCKNASDSVRILCLLNWNISESNPGEAIQYGELALKTAKKITDQSLIADAYDAAGLASRLDGNIEQAKERYKTAMELGIKNNFPGRIAWSSNSLAELIFGEGNYKALETLIHRSYKYFRQVNNPRMAFNSYYGLIKLNPVPAADSLRKYITDYLPQVQNESEKMFYYLELTNLCNLSNNRKQAMYFVQLAMELAEKNKSSKGIIKAYYQIAGYFSNVMHNYSLALTYYEKIKEENTKLKFDDQGSVLVDMGEMHRLLGNSALALSYFNKALESAQKAKHRHSIASAYLKLGDVNYQQKNYTDALFYYIKCYDTNCDVCPKIKFHDALVNIGNVYLFSNDIGNAKKYYQKSLQIADSASSSRAQSYSWQAFAYLYEKQGDINNAIACNQKAMQYAVEAGYLEGQQYNAEKLSNLYAKRNDFKQALQYKNQSNSLKDSIAKINEIGNLAKFETYFDFQHLQVQRELEKTKSNEEIGRQKLFRNFFITGFILIGLVGLLIFIGYRRKRKANMLLHEQKLAIESMAAKVHEADQAKLEFYTNVSHELKTPLTLILGMTEKLKSVVNEGNAMHIVRKNALKLLQLVNHLLDLRKIDSSNMHLQVKEGDLIEFLKGISSSFDNLFQQKQLTVEFQAQEPVLSGYFDHDKLEKIFSNLVSNAIKYTPGGGTVHIGIVKRNDGYAELNVTDNGIGIPEHEIHHIFERFYRVPGNNNQGSGIGLALVKEMVVLHKGEIKVMSKKNQGSRFTVIFPVDKNFYTAKEMSNPEVERSNWNYADVLDIEGDNTDEKEPSEPDPDSKTILIVEDNTDLRKFIAGIFNKEYAVIEAQDGVEGYKKSRTYVPDIIVSDIMMPNMSGLQLVDKLRSDITTSHIPIVLLTAKNDITTHINSFEKGVDDFISKPFDSSILKSRVENLLRLRKQLVEKFSKQFQLQPREISIENADQQFIQKAIEIIEKNMSNPNLNVDLLAMELAVSRIPALQKTQCTYRLSAQAFYTDYPFKKGSPDIAARPEQYCRSHGCNRI